MSGPFSRILLATEHTDFDIGAERVAFELVKACGTRLFAVLPMVTNIELEATAPEVVAQAEEAAFARLTALRSDATAAGIDVDARVRRGEDPSDEIVAEAQERGADLVVLRRRGKRGFLARLLVGEMVGRVASLAPCSVLLVPRAGRLWTQRVLAAVDRSAAAARVVEAAAAIAARCNVPLTVASVAAQDSAAARAAADAAVAAVLPAARSAGVEAEARVVAGRPDEVIVALAGEIGADLVVVGRSGERGVVSRRALGSVAHRVVGLAACPVLVVKP